MSSSLTPISLNPSPRPPRLPIFKTYIYRTIPERKSPLYSQGLVPELQLPIDIYIPHQAPSTSEPEQASPSSPSTSTSPTSTHRKPKHPILLSIHGGAWIASNKLDYPSALFSRFLEVGFVIASPDYRLLPESTFEEQCSDIAALEKWLREDLGEMLGKEGEEGEEGDLASFGEVDGERIVVTGASAGAHLALLTPKLWKQNPAAILSMYGPTDLSSLPYRDIGKFNTRDFYIPPCTHGMLAQATRFDNPKSETKIADCEEDYRKPRKYMAQLLWREEIFGDFLVRGLRCNVLENGTEALYLPVRGSASKAQIDAISPISICKEIEYPPIYQIIGSGDECFFPSQLTNFEAVLREREPFASRPEYCVTRVLEHQSHAFDMRAERGNVVDVEVLVPAVEWCRGWVEGERVGEMGEIKVKGVVEEKEVEEKEVKEAVEEKEVEEIEVEEKEVEEKEVEEKEVEEMAVEKEAEVKEAEVKEVEEKGLKE